MALIVQEGRKLIPEALDAAREVPRGLAIEGPEGFAIKVTEDLLPVFGFDRAEGPARIVTQNLFHGFIL